MKYLKKILTFLSSLKVAILLLLIIAISCAIGTALPQGESNEVYLEKYQVSKFLGFINGKYILDLQLNHVYSSFWFLSLLAWLSLALIICSYKRQWPMLKKAMDWVDYKDPRQIRKLAISKSFRVQNPFNEIDKLQSYLINSGWNVQRETSRFAARKGVIGRIGPPLVHLGLIVLIFGATLGVLKGERLEKFLIPGKSLELSNNNGSQKISLQLNNFNIERDPNGQPEQFRSSIKLIDKNTKEINSDEISVNHPLRYKGITLYQADWSLAAITIQVNDLQKVQLPLK